MDAIHGPPGGSSYCMPSTALPGEQVWGQAWLRAFSWTQASDLALNLRWPRSTNPSTLRLYSFTPRPLIAPLHSQIPPLDNQIPQLDYQIPPLDCQSPSLDDLRFLHSMTSDSFTRRPPNSSTTKIVHSTTWNIVIMLPPNGRRLN